MSKKVLITGAGGGGSNNLIRDLKKVNKNITVIGTNIDRFQVAKSIADKSYLISVSTDTKNYLKEINKLIKEEGVALIIPNNDREVGILSENREKVTTRLFLPEKKAVSICQDKWELYCLLKKHNIPQALTFKINTINDIQDTFNMMVNYDQYWIRPVKGSGSKGATRVKTKEQAVFWIKYWNDIRGINIDQFTISEFLPGRDLAVQSTWKKGKLILMKIVERLSYYGGDARPSGMSSTPQLAKTVRIDEVINLCQKVAKLVSDNPNGNFNFDLKQNSDGIFCITEINIGRFCMITPIFDLSGKYNMIDTYIKLALDEKINIDNPIDIEENVYLIRELDTEPLILREKEIDPFVNTI